MYESLLEMKLLKSEESLALKCAWEVSAGLVLVIKLARISPLDYGGGTSMGSDSLDYCENAKLLL